MHTLSIILFNGHELTLLLAIIPNIRCLRVGLGSTPTFDSSLWSSIVLSHLVEFHVYAESTVCWSVGELKTLLCIMPAIQRLSLHFTTTDERLLDGQQVQGALSAVNILHLNDFNYAIEYGGPQLEHKLILNLPQTWIPQPIALEFNAECNSLCLHTIPCRFRRFWTQKSSYKLETPRLEQRTVSCYGDGAYITECHAYIPWNLSELYAVMQRSCRVKNLILWLPNDNLRKLLGKYLINFRND